MYVTEATPDDIPVIHALAEKIWKVCYPSIITNEQIDYMLALMYSGPALEAQMKEGQRFFLLNCNGQASGYLSYSDKGEGHYFLHKLYVAASLQGSGAGQFLLNEVTGKLKDIKSLRLTVNRQNYKAINFYFKNGFVIEAVKDFDIGKGYLMNDFVMLKNYSS